MPDTKDVRWKQRFSNYKSALSLLEKYVQKGSTLSELEKPGLIKSFELVYELAWNTLKDYYEQQGEAGIQGSKDTIRLAFKRGLLEDGHSWMEMIKSRIKTVHIYDQDITNEISKLVIDTYYPLFRQLENKLSKVH